MAFLTVNGKSSIDHKTWNDLISLLYDESFPDEGKDLCRIQKEWFQRNFCADGYTVEAIEMVKAFDNYLSSDARSSHLSSLCLPSLSKEACPFQIRAVRQLLRIGWKLTIPCPEKEHESSLAACRRLSFSGRHDRESEYFHRAKRAVHLLFEGMMVPSIESLRMKFGPGSTAESLRLLPEKLESLQWSRRWAKYARPSDLYAGDQWLNSYSLQYIDRPITKLVAVPKDVRGPRIISMEPNTCMLLQQGIWLHLEGVLRKRAKEIQFRDQALHRARLNESEYSSLDLSDASDYVSRRLVWNLFPRKWAEFLFAFRSEFIDYDGALYPIRAFAPMGSALCFPIEAIVHWAAVKAAQLDLPKKERKTFTVYGDDIIVHSSLAGSVMTSLRSLGLQPNERKCFINTAFRESCGLDLFISNGKPFDVTPAYIRSPLRYRSNIQDVLQVSTVQNHLYRQGLKDPSALLTKWAKTQSIGLPILEDCSFAGTCLLADSTVSRPRFNRDKQRLEIRTIALEPKSYRFSLTDGQAAFGCLGLGYDAESAISGINHPKWRWVEFRP